MEHGFEEGVNGGTAGGTRSGPQANFNISPYLKWVNKMFSDSEKVLKK